MENQYIGSVHNQVFLLCIQPRGKEWGSSCLKILNQTNLGVAQALNLSC